MAIKSDDGKERRGQFIDSKGARTTIDFLGWDEELVIHEPPENFISDEHYAEAIRIADRSYASGDSTASAPGGFTASIYKIDNLEFLSTGMIIPPSSHSVDSLKTGKKTRLGDHNQIYTLALLINHLKYGLAEPALVVSVTPDWIKVAAYTCEFDTIVVLGFPAKAIDLIAPGKTRPIVGDHLLVVSQFTYRGTPSPQGVQGDITMGPNTLGERAPILHRSRICPDACRQMVQLPTSGCPVCHR
jgi:hypothetical protein